MKRLHSLVALGVVLAGSLGCAGAEPPPQRPAPPPPPPLPPPVPPIGYQFVINNTAQPQTCAFRQPNGSWSAWFVLPPGANWRRDNLGVTIFFQCRPPVRQQQYTVAGGRRYSLLRAAGGAVQLVEVTASRP
jgi:hypothetical protein